MTTVARPHTQPPEADSRVHHRYVREWDAPPAAKPLTWRSSALSAATIGTIAADLLAFTLASTSAFLLRATLRGPMLPAWEVWGSLIGWLVLRYYAQLYPGYGLAGPEELRRSTMTTSVIALGHAAMIFALKDLAASLSLALGTWALVLPISLLLRGMAIRALIRLRLFGAPVVIAGAGSAGVNAIRQMQANPKLGLVPVAIFDDDPTAHGSTIDGVPVLGRISAAVTWQFPYPVRQAIIATPNTGRSQFTDTMRVLMTRFPVLGVLPELFGPSNLWVRARALGTCLTLEIHNHRFSALNRRSKRAFDLLVGIPALIIATPVIGLVALLVKVVSPGPAFYFQEREGVDGERIRVWKIRTMVPDAEARLGAHLERNADARAHWERHMKLVRDPRVIPYIGTFLRRSSIDELPQLWNVLVGDMSLVGPRPLPDYHLRRFTADFRKLRREVPPGVSGLWQVSSRSDGELEEQVAFDSYYIHNWSLWLDLWILLQTARAVISSRGAY